MMPKSRERWFENKPTRPPMIGLVEFMPRHQTHAPTMRDIEPLSPMVDLRRPELAVLLAREQEEYDEYLVGGTANETPSYLVKLRAAQQAAQNAVSSTRDELRFQYPYRPVMWAAIAIAFSILLFLKLRYG
jgi:hypothetical protein